MAKLKFNIESIRYLVNAAIESEKNIIFVKSSTIFLRVFNEEKIILYAKGYNNRGLDRRSDEWDAIYRKAAHACGGDDFIEEIDPHEVKSLLDKSEKEANVTGFEINITKTRFGFGVIGTKK